MSLHVSLYRAARVLGDAEAVRRPHRMPRRVASRTSS